MNRLRTIAITDSTTANRARPRWTAGACCLLIAIELSKAQRDHDLPARTTVELRISEQWSPC